MDNGNFPLWLAWALFGSFFVWLVWTRYRPAVLRAPAAPVVEEVTAPPLAPPAWLFCEDGTPLDRRVQWFALRRGGRTVVGARPRAATEEASYVYLTADDIREDHALLTFDAAPGRYFVESLPGGEVLHNNEVLPSGQRAELADGDTLDLGRTSRFRFTLHGPEGDS